MIIAKIGGANGNNMDNVLVDLAGRQDYVLVHGGSNVVDQLAEELGRTPRFITSPSGVDGGLILGRRKEAVRAVDNGRVLLVKDDHSGTVEQVNAGLIRTLFDAGYVPVISPPGVTPRGELINADADRIAAMVAASMKADTLVLFTNVPGLLREPSDPSSLIPEVPRDQLAHFMNFAYGRMKKKLIAAKEALEGGVARVVIASSQQSDPVERALEGMETVIR